MTSASNANALLVYTVRGAENYTNAAYPGLAGLNCDLDDSIHLALRHNTDAFAPLNHGTGVLFAKADYDNDIPQAVTKTFIDPWAFRTKTGELAFCAIRRNENAPDPLSRGHIAIIDASTLVAFPDPEFLQVSDDDIHRPTCWWDEAEGTYLLTWTQEGMTLQGHSHHLREVFDIAPACEATLSRIDTLRREAQDAAQGIPSAVSGNLLPLTDTEARTFSARFGELRHTSTSPITLTTQVRHMPSASDLPHAVCRYSDGSIHTKPVAWNQTQLDAIDWSTPGTHHVDGIIQSQELPLPLS